MDELKTQERENTNHSISQVLSITAHPMLLSFNAIIYHLSFFTIIGYPLSFIHFIFKTNLFWKKISSAKLKCFENEMNE